jgi:cbb3-type cytochrome oxidase maturation protein
MNEATLVQAIFTFLILLIFLGFFIWGIRSRQFRDIEEAKYRMLAEDDDEEKEKAT